MSQALIKPENRAKDFAKAIAKDIADEVAWHIKNMYPQAVKATPSTFLLSVKGTVINEIMAAIEVENEEAILKRLESRKKFRRKINYGRQKHD